MTLADGETSDEPEKPTWWPDDVPWENNLKQFTSKHEVKIYAFCEKINSFLIENCTDGGQSAMLASVAQSDVQVRVEGECPAGVVGSVLTWSDNSIL